MTERTISVERGSNLQTLVDRLQQYISDSAATRPFVHEHKGGAQGAGQGRSGAGYRPDGYVRAYSVQYMYMYMYLWYTGPHSCGVESVRLSGYYG